MTMSGTPSRYRLLPSPLRAACQPCQTGMRWSRLYSCSVSPWSFSRLWQPSQRLRAGTMTLFTTLSAQGVFRLHWRKSDHFADFHNGADAVLAVLRAGELPESTMLTSLFQVAQRNYGS